MRRKHNVLISSLFPFNFQQTVVYLILTAAYIAASTLVFQVHSEGRASKWTTNQLLAIAVSLINLNNNVYQCALHQ